MFGKRNRNGLHLYILQHICISCEYCIEVCRRKVIKMVHTELESYAAVESPSLCTGCRRCEKACPVGAIELMRK